MDERNQITEGVIWKQLLIFFFPIMIGTFFQQIYNTADSIVVGRFVGKEALAAVGGSVNQIVNLVVEVFVGLTSGASVIAAQFYGAKDRKNLNKTLHTSYAFGITTGCIVGVLGFFLTDTVLTLMKTPQELMADSRIYQPITLTTVIPVMPTASRAAFKSSNLSILQMISTLDIATSLAGTPLLSVTT